MRSFPLPIRHSNLLPQTVQLQGVSPNRVLAGVKSTLNAVYPIEEIFGCGCYITQDKIPVYALEPQLRTGYGALRSVRSLTAQDYDQTCSLMKRIISGIKSDSGCSTELRELAAALRLEKSDDDKYFRLWYLRLCQAAKDAAHVFGLLRFKSSTGRPGSKESRFEQVEHRNAIAHWETGKVDFGFVAELQRSVNGLIRTKYSGDQDVQAL